MEIDEEFTENSSNNHHPHISRNHPSAAAHSSPSPPENNTIRMIQSDLEQVEQTLSSTRSAQGRAAFNSVASTLQSLRARITAAFRNEQAQTEGDTAGESAAMPPSSAATTAAAATAAAAAAAVSSGPPVAAAMQREMSQASSVLSDYDTPAASLMRRLEQAELAHSAGIPLGILQQQQQQQEQQSQNESISSPVTSPRHTGKYSPEDDNHNETNESSNEQLSEDTIPGEITMASDSESSFHSSYSNNQTAARRRKNRRASALVASRQSFQDMQHQAVHTELHGSATDWRAASASMAALDKVSEHLEEDQTDASQRDASQDLWTEESPKSMIPEEPAEAMETATEEPPPEPTSVLYSWGVPPVKGAYNPAHDRHSPVTATHKTEEDDENAAPFPQSYHDDKRFRSLTSARVAASGRLGRSTIVALHTGPKHSAVVTSTGELLASGSNESGQVDPYRRDDVYIFKPTLVESLSMARISQVACGRSHTAALVVGGQVLTWGSNAVGQLGRGPTPTGEPHTFRKPAAMILGPGVRASTVACGHDFTAVLTSRMRLLICGSQDVVAWDYPGGNSVGSGGPTGRLQPRYPSGLAVLEGLPLIQVAAGARHVAVVTQGGMVYAWGHNENGCCGREFPESIHVPVSMLLPETRRVLPDQGLGDSKALQRQSYQQHQQTSLVQWNAWEGPSAAVTLPDDVRVVHAACGLSHTVLLTQSGSARVFGLSQGSAAAQSLEPPVGRTFIDAAAGDLYTLLLDDMGDVYCLRGDKQQKTMNLEKVLEGHGIVALSASGRHAAALARGPAALPLAREFSSSSDDSPKYALTRHPSLLLSAVTSLVPKSKTDAMAHSKLVSGTEELFKSPAIWNSLFYNPDDCRDLYASLVPEVDEQDSEFELRQEIATVMERSMLKGLDLMRSDNVRLIYPESVRVLWLYLQNPLFRNWKHSKLRFDFRGDVILALCDTMLSLPFEGYKALLSWATLQYDRRMFREYLVEPLIAQMEKGMVDWAGARFRAVPGIVAVLKWLFHASEQSGVASPDDFYSEALGSMNPQELYEDLRRYKAASEDTRKTTFFICAHPFLLSPTTKRNLLQVEHQVDMLKAAASNVTWNADRRQFEFDPYFVLSVDRQFLLQQTLQKISAASSTDLRKSLRVVFKGEDGVDAGGVTKEFFQLLSQELFDHSSGMWSNRFGDITWFNGDCTWNFDGYYLVGVLTGLALYNTVLLDVRFPMAVYRKLLGHSLGLEDMVDEEIKNGLQALLDYEGDDVEDIFCLSFEVTWNSLGMEKRVELKPGGASIPVTSSNKEEYVLLYVKWLLVDSIKEQWEAFESGVMHVLDGSSLDLLRPDELERLVVGDSDLDFEALQANTQYEGGYDENSPVVQNFWKFCKEADTDTQLRLLKFATGSPKAPIGGLAAMPFKIQRAGPDSLQLPTTHTCFNTLLLPDYGPDYEKLSRLLGRAILECEGFGLQ